MKKTILGLDLGIASLGWAIISEEDNSPVKIIDMGSRIIPLSADDKDEFSKGNAISKNQKRTIKRTQRKGYFRYKLRRENLRQLLKNLNMLPEKLINISSLELFGLRDKAVKERISLHELGRVLYHLNQKRGYKSSRSDANLDKKDTDYVAEVKSRHQMLKDSGETIGQYFYKELQKDRYYRIKQQVFPREAYIEEFDAIVKEQRQHYPQILTDIIVNKFRNEIIYYQRKLKSQKGLVSVCEFGGIPRTNKEGKEVFAGPKVTPKSSPLFQVCKIWETINNITLKNKKGEYYSISLEQKQEVFKKLNENSILTQPKLYEILGLKSNEGWYGNKQISKGLQGNNTRAILQEILKDRQDLLNFNLTIDLGKEEAFLVDHKTGEVLESQPKKVISSDFEKQPLYQLWHTIYSIQDTEECSKALQSRFNLSEEISNKLAKIDFTKFAFGNKSAKAMRKILPYLMEGYVYSEACSFAGYNHSNFLTKDERLKKDLLLKLPLLKKNSLRQPIVEKILNQLVNLVNALIEKHGRPDEIRIELARELKQSKDERNDTFNNLSKIERENKNIIDRIEKDYSAYGVRATKTNILKWRLFHEINNEEGRLNATCIYCGNPFGITDALLGNSVDVEHIIPKAKLFDDSKSNKTLVHRKCNEDKGNKTAYDYISEKGEAALARYIETVDSLYKSKIIGKGKRDKLLMSESKIPTDFIERQLRETQYIARKAKEILEQVCYTVWSTSGNITEYLRRIWGWNDVLMNLQMPKYKEQGLTVIKEWQTNDGQLHKREEIKDWSKRDDHRHHAIDALVIACTKQDYITKINTLNASKTRDEMLKEIEASKDEYDRRKNLLENYFFKQKPFTTKQVELVASKILISFKPGKRVATLSKLKATGLNADKGVIVPRGPLSEESVYGKIKSIEKNKPVKYLFENSDLIFKPYIKALVKERLSEHENNHKAALASLKKSPIYLDDNKTIPLEHGTCFKDEYVIKYPLLNLKAKDVQYIVDKKIKEVIKTRLEQFGNNEKEAFKSPVWLNEEKQIPIKTVRCFTGLAAVVPVKKDNEGRDIGFVKPGNNHHIAIYLDENGKKQEHICTFWHAVERKKYGIPVVIQDPKEIWSLILTSSLKYPDSFLSKLPLDNWRFNHSLQQNEMFILGMQKEELMKALQENNKELISKYLYVTWSISESDYWFRHHLETKNSELKSIPGAKESKRYYRCKSIGAFELLNPLKVKITNLGDINYYTEE